MVFLPRIGTDLHGWLPAEVSFCPRIFTDFHGFSRMASCGSGVFVHGLAWMASCGSGVLSTDLHGFARMASCGSGFGSTESAKDYRGHRGLSVEVVAPIRNRRQPFD